LNGRKRVEWRFILDRREKRVSRNEQRESWKWSFTGLPQNFLLNACKYYYCLYTLTNQFSRFRKQHSLSLFSLSLCHHFDSAMDAVVVMVVDTVVSSSSTVVGLTACNDPYTLPHNHKQLVLFANPTTTSLLIIRHWRRTIKADRLKPGILYYFITTFIHHQPTTTLLSFLVV